MAGKVCVQCKRAFTPAPGSRAQFCNVCASEQTIAGPVERLSQARTIADRPAAGAVRAPQAAAPIAPPSAATGNAAALGPYTVLDELGRGAMGQVLKAWDDDLRREVAVKVLLPANAADASLCERFIEEARITGQLEHPGIAPVYFMGQAASRGTFFSMKLVSGQTLNELLTRWHANDAAIKKEFSLARLLSIFERVVETVGFAHAHGVIHRDLKPANIMVGTYGEVWVLDWGLAKQLDTAPPEPGKGKGRAHKKMPSRDSTLTIEGTIVGTPAYMPPEQALGGQLDARSDLFSLGAVLYQILTGQAPYEAGSASDAVERAANSQFKPVHKAGAAGRRAPPALRAITHKCMAYEPEDRYTSAQALLRDLRAYAAGDAVAALPDNWSARLTRLARRHRRALIFGTAAALLLLTATTTITAMTLLIWKKDRQAMVAEAAAKADRERAQQAELERERAENAVARKARLRMDAFEPYSRAADLHGRNIRMFDAAKLLQHALTIDPDFLEAQFLLADTLRATGTPQQAAEAFVKANALSERFNGRPHLQALVGAGFAYNNAGMYDKAEDVFKQAEAVSTTEPLALVGKAFTLIHHRRLREAHAVAQDALKKGVEFWECNFALGYVLLEAAKDGVLEPEAAGRDAVYFLKFAQRMAPNQAEVLHVLSMVNRNDTLGQFEESLKLLTQAIDLEPNNPTRYFNRALMKQRLDPAGADADFALAQRRNLPPMHVTMYRSRQALVQGRLDDAFELLSELLSGHRNWPPLVTTWLHMGINLNKLDRVKPVFEQWARDNPEYPEVYGLRAALLARASKRNEAAAEVEKGLKLAPYNAALLKAKEDLKAR